MGGTPVKALKYSAYGVGVILATPIVIAGGTVFATGALILGAGYYSYLGAEYLGKGTVRSLEISKITLDDHELCKCIFQLTQAINAKPEDHSLRLRRATTFLMKYDFLNAINDLEYCVENKLVDMRVLFLLGNAYIQMERRIKADECFRRALDMKDQPLLELWTGSPEKTATGLRRTTSKVHTVTDAHNVVDRKENMTLFEIYAVHAINLFHMLFRYPADHPTRQRYLIESEEYINRALALTKSDESTLRRINLDPDFSQHAIKCLLKNYKHFISYFHLFAKDIVEIKKPCYYVVKELILGFSDPHSTLAPLSCLGREFFWMYFYPSIYAVYSSKFHVHPLYSGIGMSETALNEADRLVYGQDMGTRFESRFQQLNGWDAELMNLTFGRLTDFTRALENRGYQLVELTKWNQRRNDNYNLNYNQPNYQHIPNNEDAPVTLYQVIHSLLNHANQVRYNYTTHENMAAIINRYTQTLTDVKFVIQYKNIIPTVGEPTWVKLFENKTIQKFFYPFNNVTTYKHNWSSGRNQKFYYDQETGELKITIEFNDSKNKKNLDLTDQLPSRSLVTGRRLSAHLPTKPFDAIDARLDAELEGDLAALDDEELEEALGDCCISEAIAEIERKVLEEESLALSAALSLDSLATNVATTTATVTPTSLLSDSRADLDEPTNVATTTNVASAEVAPELATSASTPILPSNFVRAQPLSSRASVDLRAPRKAASANGVDWGEVHAIARKAKRKNKHLYERKVEEPEFVHPNVTALEITLTRRNDSTNFFEKNYRGVAKCTEGIEMGTEFQFDAWVEIADLDKAIADISGFTMDWLTGLDSGSVSYYSPNLVVLKNLVDNKPTPEGEIYDCHLEPLPPIDVSVLPCGSHTWELVMLGRLRWCDCCGEAINSWGLKKHYKCSRCSSIVHDCCKGDMMVSCYRVNSDHLRIKSKVKY